MTLERFRPPRSGWPWGLLRVPWQVGGGSMAVRACRLAGAPHRKWGMGAGALLYFIGLGCPARVWVRGLDLRPVAYPPGPGSAPEKTPR